MPEIVNDTLVFKSLPRMYQKKIEGEDYAILSIKAEEVKEIMRVFLKGKMKIKIINSVTGEFIIHDLIDIKFESIGYAPKIIDGVSIKQEYYSGVFTWQFHK